jgi:hypothetical protein
VHAEGNIALGENGKLEEDELHLSRTQAEGWAAAREYMNGGDPCDEKKIAGLNPYKTEIERSRWFAGFNSALDKI